MSLSDVCFFSCLFTFSMFFKKIKPQRRQEVTWIPDLVVALLSCGTSGESGVWLSLVVLKCKNVVKWHRGWAPKSDCMDLNPASSTLFDLSLPHLHPPRSEDTYRLLSGCCRTRQGEAVEPASCLAGAAKYQVSLQLKESGLGVAMP